MRRKFSLTVLLALFLVSLMPVAAQDGPAIALLLPLSNNEYVRNAAEGVRSIIEGANGSVAEFDAGFNLEEQINQIQDAITSGNFDAIILYTVDGVGITVGVDMAWEAGLPVIALDAAINADRKTLVPYKYVAGQIARTGDGDGGHIGQAIVMACEMVDPCEVAFMIGFEVSRWTWTASRPWKQSLTRTTTLRSSPCRRLPTPMSMALRFPLTCCRPTPTSTSSHQLATR